jgi:hypothetical protein
MVKRELSASNAEEEDELLLKNSPAPRPGTGIGTASRKKGRPITTTEDGREIEPFIRGKPEEEFDHQLMATTSDSRPESQKKARVSKNLSKGNVEKAASKSVRKQSSQFVLCASSAEGADHEAMECRRGRYRHWDDGETYQRGDMADGQG